MGKFLIYLLHLALSLSLIFTCDFYYIKKKILFLQNIVDSFNDQNSKLRILLLSLTSGGVGLNLIGGNHLLLFDIHWNPHLESQAQDRIYRFGQKKDVYIYKSVYHTLIPHMCVSFEVYLL